MNNLRLTKEGHLVIGETELECVKSFEIKSSADGLAELTVSMDVTYSGDYFESEQQ